jgi:hypothetical protein
MVVQFPRLKPLHNATNNTWKLLLSLKYDEDRSVCGFIRIHCSATLLKSAGLNLQSVVLNAR